MPDRSSPRPRALLLVLALAAAGALALLLSRGGDAGAGATAPDAPAENPAAARAPRELVPPLEAPGKAAIAAADVAASGRGSEPRAAAPAGPSEHAVLAGRVLLEGEETPVAGVHVVAVLRADEEARTETTDDEGRFAFRCEEAVEPSFVVVRAGEDTAGTQCFPRRRIRPGERADLVLRVTRGGSVRGRVVDPSGAGLAGARVRAWCAPARVADDGVLGEPDRTTVTDASGGFSLDALGDEFVLDAELEGHACTRRVSGETRPGEPVSGVEIVLEPARSIEGVVLEAGGAPVAGASVLASRSILSGDVRAAEGHAYPSGPGEVRTTTGPEGGFLLAPVGGDELSVRVTADAYPMAQVEHASEDGFLEIRLPPAFAVRGRVVDAAGRGIGGARVLARGGDAAAEARTAADGRFQVEGLGRDPTGRVLVHAEGHAVHVEQPVAIGDGAPPLLLRLEPERVLAGRVVDGEGRPVAGVPVEIEGDRVVDLGNVILSPTPTWERRLGLSETLTDAGGRFRFEGLYEGTFRVRVRPPEDLTRAVALDAAAGTADLEIVLDESTLRGVAFVGRATDALTGEPIERFRMTPMRPSHGGGMSGMTIEVEASEDGAFDVSGLEPGEMQISVRADGYAQWNLPRTRYERGERRLDLRLFPERDVRLRFLDAAGEPLAGGSVAFRGADGNAIWPRTSHGGTSSRLRLDGEGRVRAMALPAGWTALEVHHGSPERSATFEVDLTAAPQGELTFEVDWETGPKVAARLDFVTLAPDAGGPSVLDAAEIAGLADPSSLGAPFAGERIDVTVHLADGRVAATAELVRREGGGFMLRTRSDFGPDFEEEVSYARARLDLPAVPSRVEIRATGHAPRTLELSPEDFERPFPWTILLARE